MVNKKRDMEGKPLPKHIRCKHFSRTECPWKFGPGGCIEAMCNQKWTGCPQNATTFPVSKGNHDRRIRLKKGVGSESGYFKPWLGSKKK